MTARDLLIGVDAGTSVIKAVAFDLEGRQIAVASTPNRYHTRPDGAAFQSLDECWADTASTLRALVDKLPGLASRVAAVGVTAQGDGTWLVDRNNQAVTDAWLWLDARAAPVVRRLRGTDADRARFGITGTGLNVCQQGSQLALMLDTNPEWLAQADVALHAKDWIYLNLTGVRATDPSEACFTFGDFRTRAYDDTVIETLGLTQHRRLLPPILDGRKQTHPLTAAAAAATGLLEGAPISLGYVDVVCTALGAGLVTGEPARCTILGSTGMHMRALSAADVQPNADLTGYTMTLPFDDMVAQIQSNMAATLNIDWALALAEDLFAEFGRPVPRVELLAHLDVWLEAAPPGALIYHPYISEAGERGPFVNSAARASLMGLSARHRFADVIRAVVEGLALAARDCYAAMGAGATEVRLCGGASRSKALRGIFAAALNAPIRRAEREEAGAAGAAMIAACAVGALPDMRAAVAKWVTPTLSASEAPDATLARIYDGLYPAYLHARQTLEPLWDALAQKDTR